MIQTKKANIDLITFGVFAFVGVIIFVVVAMIAGIFRDDISPNLGLNSFGQQIATQNFNAMPGWVDTMAFFLILGMFFFIIISSYLIPSNPVFMVMGILLFFVLLLLGSVFGEVLLSFMTGTTDLEVIGLSMPKTTFLVNHWGVIMLVVGILTLIVTYGKLRGGGE